MFVEGQLVRQKMTRRTGWVESILEDNGPHAAGVVMILVEMRDGLRTRKYFNPSDLSAVRSHGEIVTREVARWT